MADKPRRDGGKGTSWIDAVGPAVLALMPFLLLVHFLCSRDGQYPYSSAFACLLASLVGAVVLNLRRAGLLLWLTLLFVGLLHFGLSPSLGSLVFPASVAGILLVSAAGGGAGSATFLALGTSLLFAAFSDIGPDPWLMGKLLLGAIGTFLLGGPWLKMSEKVIVMALLATFLFPFNRASEIIWASSPQGAIGEGSKWTDMVMTVTHRMLPLCLIVGAFFGALSSFLASDQSIPTLGGQGFRLWLAAVALAGLGQSASYLESLASVGLSWSLCIALAMPHACDGSQKGSLLTLSALRFLQATASLTVICAAAFGFSYWRALLKVDGAIPMLTEKLPNSITGLSPEVLRQVVVASEDRHFYQHSGVDWEALHRALRRNIQERRFVQGGSTITQQAARYAFLGKEKTLSRKSDEFFLAMAMERLLTKDQILEVLLANADFGFGQKGSVSASAFYFGHPATTLSFGESFFLAGALWKPPKTVQQLSAPLEHREKIAIRFLSNHDKIIRTQIWKHASEPQQKLFRHGSIWRDIVSSEAGEGND